MRSCQPVLKYFLCDRLPPGYPPIDGLFFLAALFAIGLLSGGTAAVVGFGIGSLLTPLLPGRRLRDRGGRVAPGPGGLTRAV